MHGLRGSDQHLLLTESKKPDIAKGEAGLAGVFSSIYRAPASCSKSAQSQYINPNINLKEPIKQGLQKLLN
jgi:hypothetical protein